MNFLTSGSWWQSRLSAGHVTPEDLVALAERCEHLPAADQRKGFEQALRVLADTSLAPDTGVRVDESMWVSLLADSGAFESAAIALLPSVATYTISRMGDGQYQTQIALPSGAGGHSRGAHALSMAVLAALLRALARDMIEAKSAH